MTVTASPARQAVLSELPLPPLDTASPLWPGRTVEVAGTQLFVRHAEGEPGAEPALHVHGLGGSSTNWTDLMGQLRGYLDSEAIDLPGYGQSGPAADGDYSLGAQALEVINYLDESGRGPVHLISNSMGGAISILIAGRRPDLVRTLTLISAYVPDPKLARLHAARNNPSAAVLAVPGLGAYTMRQVQQRYPLPARARATVALCFADPSRFSETRMRQSIEEVESRAAMTWADEAFLRSLRALISAQFHQRSFWAAAASITAPTLVVGAAHDRLVAPALAPLLAERIPGAQLLELPDAGHVSMMEDPVTVARAVLGLVERARA